MALFPNGQTRILIVDDDPGIRDSYMEILTPTPMENILGKGAILFDEPGWEAASLVRPPYNLTFVSRGEEGVEEVGRAVEQKNPFAVAFIDMKLPGIDGAATARLIWTLDPNVKIVVVTAFSEYTPKDIIEEIGADDIFYLSKPFKTEEIRQFARALTNQWNLEHEKEFLADELEKNNVELESLNKNLRLKVEEQTTLLIQSEKLSSIGLLAAGVAHEINNPISFVKSNLMRLIQYSKEVAELFKMYEEVKRHFLKGEMDRIPPVLKKIKTFEEIQKMDFILKDMAEVAKDSLEGTNRVSKIVCDLQNFARVGKEEIKSVRLEQMIEATLNIIWNELKYKAEVIRDFGETPEVNCYPQKISQVLMNILMNAVQAIAEKGTIRISTRFFRDGRKAEDGRVEVRIADTGQGIPKENLGKIFDPFFTTKPVGMGTGLGLSITYEIVQAHGGKIYVASEEGVGTAFTVSLPVSGPK